MATISGLTTLAAADVATTDQFVIYDASAGTDKKITYGDVVYNIGTWTPVLNFGGATTGITYGTQTGNYYRIGSLYFVEFSITLTSKGSATGNATITGLPAAAAAAAPGVSCRFYTALASVTGTPFGYIGSTTITLAMAGATDRTVMTNSNFANTSRLDMWGMYYA